MQGKIIRWNEEKGFGFIQEQDTQVEIFVSISAFAVKNPQPIVGDIVSFITHFNEDKARSEAMNVLYLNRKDQFNISNADNNHSRWENKNKNSIYGNNLQVELNLLPLEENKDKGEDEFHSNKRSYKGILLLFVVIVLLLVAYWVYKNNLLKLIGL
ncbi:MAG: cold shock domain-containing protein [Neisseriaceae bacterium]|nr:cold shock domain-containing protein [Neisseriaceae bacterium]